jgi:hypothetical protein
MRDNFKKSKQDIERARHQHFFCFFYPLLKWKNDIISIEAAFLTGSALLCSCTVETADGILALPIRKLMNT